MASAKSRYTLAYPIIATLGMEISAKDSSCCPFPRSMAFGQGYCPSPHKDPFDRMLIAQSQAENTPIISNEAIFESHGVRRLW